MRRFGLIGRKLSHSFSRKYFGEKFKQESIPDASYDLFEIESANQFPALVKSLLPDLKGLNVTIPYKKEIIPYLNQLDASAEKVGAVNVIKVEDNGSLTGFNSDYYGFKVSLENWITGNDSALVLGTGGAADAVCAVLNDLMIKYKLVSRNQIEDGYTYEDLKNSPEIVEERKLIVNTTPLGMYPNIDKKPDLPYHVLGKNHQLYDLVYNPEVTSFMQAGIDKNARVKNGLEMLELQAEKSWEIWNS